VSDTSNDVIVYAARHTRLNRFLELLWKRRRNRPGAGERKIDPRETDPFSKLRMYDEGSTESEIIFMSIMWMGM